MKPFRYWKDIKRLYKISKEEYFYMLVTQKGQCKICERYMSPICIDHCHETNTTRGLLCKKCNFGIGHFDDNIFILANAINYLKGVKRYA